MRQRFALFSCFVILCLCLFGCQGEQECPEPDLVRLQLKWVHQAQFVGFYMALEKGYYKQENIQVVLLEGGTRINQAQRLLTNEADFAVVPAEMVLLNNNIANPLIALSVLYQRNPTVFVAKADSGIIRPKDFKGKKIAVGNLRTSGFIEGIVQLNTLLQRKGIDPTSISIVPYDSTYASFLSDQADVTPAYLVGGVIKLRNKNIPLNIIWPGDYGVDFYGDTLVTTSSLANTNPDLALRFLRASLKGWQYSINNQQEAVAVALKYSKIKNEKVQREMMDAQVPLVHTGSAPIGWMQGDVWAQMYEAFLEQGMVKHPIEDIQSIYSKRFLKQIYPEVAQ